MEVTVQSSDNNYELAFNSESRDAILDTDSSYWELNLEGNPIKNVKRMKLVDTVIPIVEPGLTATRQLEWVWLQQGSFKIGDPPDILFPNSVDRNSWGDVVAAWNLTPQTLSGDTKPAVNISSSDTRGMIDKFSSLNYTATEHGGLFFCENSETPINLLLITNEDNVINETTGRCYFNIVSNVETATHSVVVKVRAGGLTGNADGTSGVLPQSVPAATEYTITTVAPGEWKKITPQWTQDMWEGTFTYEEFGLADPHAFKVDTGYVDTTTLLYDGAVQFLDISPASMDSIDDLMTTFSTAMSGDGKTVSWEHEGRFIKVTSSHRVQLFPNLPGVTTSIDAYDLWEYVAGSFIKQMGFSLTLPLESNLTSPGPVIEATKTITAPHQYNISGPPYVLLKLDVNGQSIGRVWENDAGNVRIGPYFARIMLKNKVGDLNICENHVSNHYFSSATTIKKMVFELVNPVVGLLPTRYQSLGRDWIANIRFEEDNKADFAEIRPVEYDPTTTRKETLSTETFADKDVPQFYWEQNRPNVTQ